MTENNKVQQKESGDHHEDSHDLHPNYFDHATKPRNIGYLHNPDGRSEVSNPCGDTIQVFLETRNGIISNIYYSPRSCVTTLACISYASTLVENKTLVEARRGIDADTIDVGLGGIPADHRHCCELAAKAIHSAIDDAIRSEREPWKRLYRIQ